MGLVSSKKKRLKKVVGDGADIVKGGTSFVHKKKAGGEGGVIRHPILTLKKVARLPSKDRAEVMKVLNNFDVMKSLKKKIRRRQQLMARAVKSAEEVSIDSSNKWNASKSVNDWQNWMVLRGNEEVVSDDIQGFGKAIGVSFQGKTQNMFKVLSRPKQDTNGSVELAKEVVDGAGEGRG